LILLKKEFTVRNMTQRMEFRSGDIYINDVLAWRNPDRSGMTQGVSAHHDGNELWVNGNLVYTHPGSEQEEEERPPPRKVVLQPRNRVLVRVIKVAIVLLFILIIIWLFR
jgi:hypothetical protein